MDLARAIARLETWPAQPGEVYVRAATGRSGAPSPPADEPVAAYLARWPRRPDDVAAVPVELRRRIASLWRRRPELRPLLGGVIGALPCPELARAFVRHVRAGGDGALRAWVGAVPEVASPLRMYFRDELVRFQHADRVVRACLALTRALDEPAAVWRHAALAIRREDRRPLRWRREHVRVREVADEHLAPDELDALDRHLVALGAEPLPGRALSHRPPATRR